MEIWVRNISCFFVTLVILCSEVSAKKGGGGGGGSGGVGDTSVWKSRGGSRLSSGYIKNIPEISYERVYTVEYNRYYHTYYQMYFNYSGTINYLTRPRPNSFKIWVCANYEANEDGHVMGVFTCPNTWEPETFRTCCGADYHEFCCEVPDPNGTRSKNVPTVTVMGVLIAALVLYVVYKIDRSL